MIRCDVADDGSYRRHGCLFVQFVCFSENEGRPAGLKFNPPFNKGRTYIGINTNPFEPLRQSSCAILMIKRLSTTVHVRKLAACRGGQLKKNTSTQVFQDTEPRVPCRL
jgi:hypothetical protein